MKKFLVFLVLYPVVLSADLVFDPVRNEFYSSPRTTDINEDEYVALILKCYQVKANIQNASKGYCPDTKHLLKQYFQFLRQIGTSTALRLISDLEKNKIFYPDGSVFHVIFE